MSVCASLSVSFCPPSPSFFSNCSSLFFVAPEIFLKITQFGIFHNIEKCKKQQCMYDMGDLRCMDNICNIETVGDMDDKDKGDMGDV